MEHSDSPASIAPVCSFARSPLGSPPGRIVLSVAPAEAELPASLLEALHAQHLSLACPNPVPTAEPHQSPRLAHLRYPHHRQIQRQIVIRRPFRQVPSLRRASLPAADSESDFAAIAQDLSLIHI